MPVTLTPVEARVLGCLVEKELTTPEYYPLTLNALVAACNQKSNRDPVLQLDERAVSDALDSLRYRKLAWQITSTGSRVAKYRHDVASAFSFKPGELAVMCELLLRGPQTVGELRGHTARMHAFADLAEVHATLEELRTWGTGPLVACLGRESGRREPRYAHLLCGDIAPPEQAAAAGPAAAAVAPAPASAGEDRMAALEAAVAALRSDVETLKARLEEFRRQFE